MIDWLEKHLGANRVVLALSLARLGDGVGNSVLIVVLPLYVAAIPSRWPLPTSVGATFAIVVGMVAVQAWVKEPEDVPDPGARFQLFDRSWLEPGLLPLGLATFVMAANMAMITALENDFNERLDQTALGFGVAFSALTLTRVVFQAPLGRLSDLVGRQPLVLGGLVLLAPGTAALGYAATTLQLTGVRLFQGLATAAIAAPAFALAADLATEGREARQMSLLTTGFAWGSPSARSWPASWQSSPSSSPSGSAVRWPWQSPP